MSDTRTNDDLPDDTKVREQFLKISGAKYITDGQVVISRFIHSVFMNGVNLSLY